MEQAKLMHYFPDKDLTFKLGGDLDCYNFTLNDTIQEMFQKYYKNDIVDISEQTRLTNLLYPSNEVKSLGYRYNGINFGDKSLIELKTQLIDLLAPVETILNY
jgi:hypothetical protein